MTIRNICVYCSSSTAAADKFCRAAEELGAALARGGYRLVYGGVNIGLMGKLAAAAKTCGGEVIGVVPEVVRELGITYTDADEIIYTADLRQRKQKMEELADAFIALPGGFGTLEELLEILTLRQLGTHDKPVVILDIDSYFQSLAVQFEVMYKEKMAKDIHRTTYAFISDIELALEFIRDYQPVDLGSKIF